MKKVKVIETTKNHTTTEKCWVCINDGYIVVNLMIYHCDCCEAGIINDDSTVIQEPVSKNFNVEDMIDRNKYYAKRNA